jgi:hypothetical protein
MANRKTKVTNLAATREPDLTDIEYATDKAIAALWILDQAQYGELCFLSGAASADRDKIESAWTSFPAAQRMTIAEMRGALMDICLTTLGEALGQAREAVEALQNKAAKTVA